MNHNPTYSKNPITSETLTELNHIINRANRENPNSKSLKASSEENEDVFNNQINQGMTMLFNSLALLKLHDIPLIQAVELIIEKDKAERSNNKTQNNPDTSQVLEEIQNICDGIEYSRNVPEEAKKLAKENGYVIIVGGSDDLMYAYGADCYLTDYVEHAYGWDGNTLKNISDKKLQKEAEQLGLMIWWGGKIREDHLVLPAHDSSKDGAFTYTVKNGIEFRDFKVMENNDVYCTGKIIKLPANFKSEKEGE